ncbi:MAG TPA: hypothetical protein VEW67_01990 [Thermoleophilaceae bacterium]|nr:hypothetical protein [Thermoleophilaceae bacterium]
MARKQEEPEDVEQQEEEDEGLEDESTTSIDITDSAITITVPRDGNEGDTLTRLAGLVDGLGSK